MATANISSEEQLLRFLEKHAGDRLKTELLAFWGRHPNAKFTRGAISCALDCKKLDMDRALKDMVETGLVDTCTQNGVLFYALTANEERRRAVLKLASLNWWERKHLAFEQLVPVIEQPHDSSNSCRVEPSLSNELIRDVNQDLGQFIQKGGEPRGAKARSPVGKAGHARKARRRPV